MRLRYRNLAEKGANRASKLAVATSAARTCRPTNRTGVVHGARSTSIAVTCRTQRAGRFSPGTTRRNGPSLASSGVPSQWPVTIGDVVAESGIEFGQREYGAIAVGRTDRARTAPDSCRAVFRRWAHPRRRAHRSGSGPVASRPFCRALPHAPCAAAASPRAIEVQLLRSGTFDAHADAQQPCRRPACRLRALRRRRPETPATPLAHGTGEEFAAATKWSWRWPQ